MYLDNYSCTHESVQIVLKNDEDTKCDSICFKNPQQMWNNVTGEWEQYDFRKANAAFAAAVGDDVNFEGYNEDEHIARLIFTRSDGYQIAIIKFLMEG